MSEVEKGKKDIDKVSGVETTGHEWDGLKELNNPAPRWWLWVFFITIVWSVGYWVVYPAWPTIGGATKGLYGWTEYKKLAAEQAEITARQQSYLAKFHTASFQDIMSTPELYDFAVAGGKAVFKDNCATCHGTGGAGSKGYPNLNDDDWLWGGKIEDIYYTIKNGVRSTGQDTRVSQMPAFGREGLLKSDEINAVVDYVLALSGGGHKVTYPQGQKIFQESCASCHGTEGKGGREVGAPNLADKIWLYGGKRQDVYETVFFARRGVMPTWDGRLSEDMIRALAVYVHELGGGESEKPAQQEPASVSGSPE